MYSIAQSLELAAAEYEEKESEPAYVWHLARSANLHRNYLIDIVKERGYKIMWEPRRGGPDVAYISKADARKLMGLDGDVAE